MSKFTNRLGWVAAAVVIGGFIAYIQTDKQPNYPENMAPPTNISEEELAKMDAANKKPAPNPDTTPDAGGDPYAAAQAKLHQADYATQKADFLARAQRIYYATTCRALDTPIPNALVQSEAAAFLQNATGAAVNVGDEKLTADIEAAERAGIAQAQAPGGCNYWKQNPEAVAEIREEARIAAP